MDFGTPEYLPPELYQGKDFTEAGDWWALGCLLFEMLSGTPPFSGLDVKRLSTKIICKCDVNYYYFYYVSFN